MSFRSVLQDCEPTASGTLEVRIAKQILNEEGAVVSTGWHRLTFDPGCNVENIIAANDADLTAKGFGAVPSEQWNLVRAAIAQEHTPQLVEAFLAHRAAVEASLL